jgi:hypothetical protein
MSLRILKFGIIASVIQILLYYLFFKVFQFLQITFSIAENERDTFSDYSIFMSTSLFGFLILTQNSLTSIINKKWFTITAFCIILMLVIIGWGEDIYSWPLQTIIFLLVNISVLISKPFIDKQISKYLKE